MYVVFEEPNITKIEETRVFERKDKEEETEEEAELREEAEAIAQLEEVARKRAERKAKAAILPLREERAKIHSNLIEHKRSEINRFRNEIDRLEKEIYEQSIEVKSIMEGERDHLIIEKKTYENSYVSVFVGQVEKPKVTQKTQTVNPREKQVRVRVVRKPLWEVIHRKTEFMTIIKGVKKFCWTDDGRTLHGEDGKTYDTLNKWLDFSICSVTVTNTTKKSVFEVVSYFNINLNSWRTLKSDYVEGTTKLN